MGIFKKRQPQAIAQAQIQALHIPPGLELFVPVRIPEESDAIYRSPSMDPPLFENGRISVAHMEAVAKKQALIKQMMTGETDKRFSDVTELLVGLAKEGGGLIPIFEDEIDLEPQALHQLIAWTNALATTTFFFEQEEFGERATEMELHYYLAMSEVANDYAIWHGGYSSLVLFSTKANFYLSKTHGQLDEIVPHAIALKDTLLVRGRSVA